MPLEHTTRTAEEGEDEQALTRFVRFAVDNLSDAAYWIREDASLIYVNQAACQLLGYTAKELLEKRIYDLNVTVSPQAWPMVWQQLREKKRRTFETVHAAKDGTEIPVEISASLFVFDGREYSCAFARDIRDRKELELRLRHAEKMEAIGLLAGGIAHDFNNQLTAILGYADLLRLRLQDNHACAPLVRNIDAAVKRATDLTSQLLAFSRKGKYVSEPVDVHRAVTEVVNVLSHSIDKKIIIEEQLDAEHSVTEADGSQLHNVLLNLALNARDALPQGGTISIRTVNLTLDAASAARHPARLEPGRYIQISVADTGQGMSKEVQRRIFEPFFTTKVAGKGTGLGLAAAYGTVRNHGGAIQVKSAAGKGTTITAFLPLSDRRPSPTRPEAERATTLDSAARILLVDDEQPVREVVTRMLRSLGCEVEAFGDGHQAVRHFRENVQQTDLVILDMVMPSMSGRETFEALREIDPRVRALLASGYSLEGEAQALLSEGVLGFIQKPYGRAELGKAISGVLGGAARIANGASST